MRTEQGGTKMSCPFCKKVRVCKGISPTQLGKRSARRWRKASHSDIHWFRRGRECQTCWNQFVTAEIDEDFLNELVQLRDALGGIKVNARKYIQQSKKASVTLSKLAESLDVLKALDLYKQDDDEI